MAEPHGLAARRHAVVVLNYYGKEDTLACLESLLLSDPEGQHVIVVDNGSHDGTLQSIRLRWPAVETLQLPTNLGFAGGMNAGIKAALRQHPATVTVLNNDTLLPPGAVPRLGLTAVEHRAAVSPAIFYAAEPNRLWFAGGTIDSDTFLPRHLSPTEVSERAESLRVPLMTTEVLAGCCVTAPTDVWLRVGGFDERYFLNFEDSDWSLRARAAGVPLLVALDVKILHRVSASFTGAYSFLGLYYYTRNGLLVRRGRDASPVHIARFMRRHVLPAVARPLRRHEMDQALRNAGMVVGAVSNHACRKYGRAPRLIEWIASRAEG